MIPLLADAMTSSLQGVVRGKSILRDISVTFLYISPKPPFQS